MYRNRTVPEGGDGGAISAGVGRAALLPAWVAARGRAGFGRCRPVASERDTPGKWAIRNHGPSRAGKSPYGLGSALYGAP
jgi:hypothetical protein